MILHFGQEEYLFKASILSEEQRKGYETLLKHPARDQAELVEMRARYNSRLDPKGLEP